MRTTQKDSETVEPARRSTSVEPVERITWNGKPLTYIVRAATNPDSTTFLTPSEFNLQVGFVVYPADGEIARHIHVPLERHIATTSEVLVVKKGRCKVDIYNKDQVMVATRELRAGDMMLTVDGGHGFRMLEDTVFLEVKQGPYIGLNEKERF